MHFFRSYQQIYRLFKNCCIFPKISASQDPVHACMHAYPFCLLWNENDWRTPRWIFPKLKFNDFIIISYPNMSFGKISIGNSRLWRLRWVWRKFPGAFTKFLGPLLLFSVLRPSTGSCEFYYKLYHNKI